MNTKKLGWFGTFLRGIAMGLAEVIPGISGGTIAFITGIYTELLLTISALGPRTLTLLFAKGVQHVWASHNLSFLALLFAGMACSILFFAKIVLYLLDSYALYLWSFFFGLISASVVMISRQAISRHLLSYGILGLALGIGVSLSSAINLPATPLMFFLAGILAVSAWILPGISGSYLMVLMGLYPKLLQAIDAVDLQILTIVAAGCITGLLAFSRVLSWLLEMHRSAVMALLAGFTAGSLVKLWPWQQTGTSLSEGHGALPLLPWNYFSATGNEPLLFGVVVALVGGLFVVRLMHKLAASADRPV